MNYLFSKKEGEKSPRGIRKPGGQGVASQYWLVTKNVHWNDEEYRYYPRLYTVTIQEETILIEDGIRVCDMSGIKVIIMSWL